MWQTYDKVASGVQTGSITGIVRLIRETMLRTKKETTKKEFWKEKSHKWLARYNNQLERCLGPLHPRLPPALHMIMT